MPEKITDWEPYPVYDPTQEKMKIGFKTISQNQDYNVRQFLKRDLIKAMEQLNHIVSRPDKKETTREYYICLPRPGTATAKTMHREPWPEFILYRCNCQHMNPNNPQGPAWPCAHIIALAVICGDTPINPDKIRWEGRISGMKRPKKPCPEILDPQ